MDDEVLFVTTDDTVVAAASSASIICGVMGRDPNPGRVNEKPSQDEEFGGLLLLIDLFIGKPELDTFLTVSLWGGGEEELITPMPLRDHTGL